MGILLKTISTTRFGTRALGYIPYGGADFGEVQAVARAVGDGDDGAFYSAWIGGGDRLAEREEKRSRRDGARARAIRFCARPAITARRTTSLGAPVNPRLVAAFRKQIAAFNDGLALLDPPVMPMRTPFGDHTFPAYFLPAAGRTDETRPLSF